MASVAAGKAGRGNEDFVGAVPTAVVLTDGAGGVAGAELVCRHDVGWYATRLGTELLTLLPGHPESPLPVLLAEAIERVTDAHRDGCDVTDPRSPWAAVAMLRLVDDRVDHLVLGDATLVLDRVGGPVVVTDHREATICQPYEERLATLVEGSAEYEQVYREAVTVVRDSRNRPGGYWVAKEDPRAAEQAYTGSCPVAELSGAVLLSNGASRIEDRFGLADWPEVLAILGVDGPGEIIRRVREAEACGAVPADDATIAHCTDPAP
ncbi:hypothetical protein [Plantactinospora sp. B5E13]|uniref:hypothetical protein n=1 Tax=Plantactinospora sp. B5E13 TaxID=3153758 RepID=UPI00325F0E9F